MSRKLSFKIFSNPAGKLLVVRASPSPEQMIEQNIQPLVAESGLCIWQLNV